MFNIIMANQVQPIIDNSLKIVKWSITTDWICITCHGCDIICMLCPEIRTTTFIELCRSTLKSKWEPLSNHGPTVGKSLAQCYHTMGPMLARHRPNVSTAKHAMVGKLWAQCWLFKLGCLRILKSRDAKLTASLLAFIIF